MTTAAPTTAKDPSSFLSRLLPWLVALLAVAGIYLGYRASLRQGVHRRLAALRAQGLPSTPAELDATYPSVPEAENAALVYLEAFEQLVEPPRPLPSSTGPGRRRGAAPPVATESTNTAAEPPAPVDLHAWLPLAGGTNLPACTEPLAANMRLAISQYLGTNAPVLELLHQAAQRSRCRYPITFAVDPRATELPHLSRIRQSSRLLVLAALLAAEAGDSANAIARLQDALALGGSLDQEPVLVSQMVRDSSRRTVADGCQQVLNRARLSPAQLQLLAERLAAVQDREPLLRGLRSELSMANTLLELPVHQALGECTSMDQMVARMIGMTGWLELNIQNYLDFHGRLLALGRQPAHVALPQIRQMERDLDQRVLTKVLVRMQYLTWQRAWERHLSATAGLLLAQVATHLERYRLATGRYPAQLQELVPAYLPALPVDPFDGQPIRYQLLPDGFRLHSVGVNGTDEGGLGPVPRYGEPPDITFRILKPNR